MKNTNGGRDSSIPIFLNIIRACIDIASQNKFTIHIYLFKFNDRNTRKSSEIRSKLSKKTPEQSQQHCFGVFIVNFEDTSHLFLDFQSLTLNK